MLNTSPINTTPLNASGGSSGSVYSETVSNSLTLEDSLVIPDYITATDGMVIALYETSIDSSNLYSSVVISDSYSLLEVQNCIDTLISLDSLDSRGNFNYEVLDSAQIQDVLQVAFPIALSNTIETSDTLGDVLTKIGNVLEAVRTGGGWSTTAQLSAIASAALAVSSFLTAGNFAEALEEGIEVSEELVTLYKAFEAITNQLTLADTVQDSASLIAISTETINLEDALADQLNLNVHLSEDIVFILTYQKDDVFYQGYFFNPENSAVTEYENYNFNSATLFNGDILAAGPTGLYRLGGNTDDGDYITSILKTATMDFGTSNIKQMPKVYLGVSNDASLILTTSVDGKYSATYELEVDSEDLSTQMFDIGKGLKGRYWQFELQTKQNSELYLDEIEFFPVQFSRKR